MTDITELAKRVEGMAEPCRATDAQVWRLAAPNEYALWESSQRAMLDRDWDEARRQVTLAARAKVAAPKFTGSIDAAMALIPADMRDELEISTLYQHARVSINLNHGTDGCPFYGSNACNSIPLAITAAALRARAALGDQP